MGFDDQPAFAQDTQVFTQRRRTGTYLLSQLTGAHRAFGAQFDDVAPHRIGQGRQRVVDECVRVQPTLTSNRER